MSSARYCILVADSGVYPGIGQLIELLGEDDSLQLAVFNNPVEALEAIKQRPPLLLITQPDWDADPEFLSQASQAIYPCPTIALVDTSSAAEGITLLGRGASDLLALPIVDRQAIEHILARNLERAELLNQSQYFRDELEQSLALLKEDQQAGRQVQLKMLPSNQVVINDYHFEYRIKPSLFLSGDFVDYFRISESLSMFYLADISGHGASSAFVTVLLKNMTNRLLRNYNRGSSFHILSPTDVLARVNKELLDTGLGKHMTIFVGLLDRIENTLQYGVGGHFPMPILRQGDRAEYLGGCGMPVGLFDDAEFEGRIVELEDEFSLTLFSDGVLEVLDQPDLKAKEKCLLDVAAQGYDDLDDLARKLGIDHVDDAPDDIAALSVTRRL
ncbi:fused response regulator/phosphatase [Motiliproteus coralliicola]|uniref:Fused response regulator/phosphatase n=1 Tax=Motiliproteus coralliicola TaxID=2283196 RepID=A0A369WCX5_9GAMM|nr:SpoIIE family protein phosphatase [Motiliproteus coralliicola]RDE19592.1 fused response regulator/phosphatase [Motiliproteus coralliicola]